MTDPTPAAEPRRRRRRTFRTLSGGRAWEDRPLVAYAELAGL